MRDDAARFLLIVVGRQPIVGGRHEGVEETPGLARHAAQLLAVLLRELGVWRRFFFQTAAQTYDGGREQPSDQERHRKRQRSARRSRDQAQYREGEPSAGREATRSA